MESRNAAGNRESVFSENNALNVNLKNVPHVIVDSAPEVVVNAECLPSANVKATAVGNYLVGGANVAVTTAADSANAGSQYLINPIGSGRKLLLKRAHISGGAGSIAVALLTTPTFQLRRFTFTGTASGAVQAICQRDTSEVAPVASLRNAGTGMTITMGATFYNYQLAQVLSAIGMYSPPIAVVQLGSDEAIVIAPGEGVALRQATAGSPADPRFVQVDWAWEEFV